VTVPRTPETIGAMGAIFQTFALALRAEGKSPKTVRTYTEAACWLAQRLRGESPRSSWSDITKDDIRRHMAWLTGNYSPAYASNQYRALQAWFRWLAEEEDIPNPMTGLKPPRVPQKLVPVLGSGELDRLLDTCNSPLKGTITNLRDRALILMFASSGARLSEICGLKLADIDLEQSAAIVLGKAGKPRIIRFSPEAAVALSRYLKARSRVVPTSVQLWVGQRGPLHPNAIALMLRRRGAKAGVHANAHRFRHDFSHRWLVNGGHPNDLMELNGWSSASMVSRYGASAASERARKHYDRVMSA
jgi:site-specific recombinase XerD